MSENQFALNVDFTCQERNVLLLSRFFFFLFLILNRTRCRNKEGHDKIRSGIVSRLNKNKNKNNSSVSTAKHHILSIYSPYIRRRHMYYNVIPRLQPPMCVCVLVIGAPSFIPDQNLFLLQSHLTLY